MKRLAWFSALLAAFLASCLGLAQVGAPVAGAPNTSIANITSGNARYLVGRSELAFIKAPTGSMANNGVVTLGTALDRTYGHAYIYLPAGAVAAGVPAAAAWLYCEMSSTTVGTVYNVTYTTGMPIVPATKTAFATTGPGAFVGVTTEVTGPQFPMATNAMGPDGLVVTSQYWTNNNSAGAKVPKTTFGGTTLYGPSRTTSTSSRIEVAVKNEGVTNVQWSDAVEVLSTGGVVVGTTPTAVDTTAAVTLANTFTVSGAATDWLVLVRTEWYALGDGN